VNGTPNERDSAEAVLEIVRSQTQTQSAAALKFLRKNGNEENVAFGALLWSATHTLHDQEDAFTAPHPLLSSEEFYRIPCSAWANALDNCGGRDFLRREGPLGDQ